MRRLSLGPRPRWVLVVIAVALLTWTGGGIPLSQTRRLEAVVVLVIALLLASLLGRRGTNWWSPEALPTAYFVCLTAIPPIVALRWGPEFGRLKPAMITPAVLDAVSLAIVGWLGGLLLGRSLGSKAVRRPGAVSSTCRGLAEHAWRPAHAAALTWGVNLGGQAALLIFVRRAHGEGQAGYDAFRAVDIISSALITAGAALFVVHLALVGPAFRRFPLLLAGASALTILASGERGVLLAPALLLAAGFEIYVRRIPRLRLLVSAAIIMTSFSYIQSTRSGFDADLSPISVVEAMVVDWSSPTRFMATMTAASDQGAFEMTNGSTYVATAARQLPGVISNPLFGDSFVTSDKVYRDLVGLTDENQGFGFAYAPEGYMNFGRPGLVLMPFVLSFALSRLYSGVRNDDPLSFEPYLYLVLLAALPAGLRQNSLGFTKTVLYNAVIVSAMLLHLRSVSRSLLAPALSAVTPKLVSR